MPVPYPALSSIVAFVKLGRPHFLLGGFLLYALGAAIAAAYGHSIAIGRYLLGQAAVTALQWMTHYANDYFDYDADRANSTPTRWSGGSRVLADGTLRREVALWAALVLAALGITAAIALALDGGGLALPTLALVGLLAWEYSAPPLRLCATGLGEADTAIVVTVLVPWLGFSLHAPHLAGAGALALSMAPLALLQVAMSIAIELPDAAGDVATGKRTLVVRLGARRAAHLYAALTAAAYMWPIVAAFAGLPLRVVLAMAAPAPLALWRIVRIREHTDPAGYERLTLWAVFLFVATSLAQLVAWLAG